ncbi:hypothetical protein AAHH80_34970, partial [Burkholderia pseudomallei]
KLLDPIAQAPLESPYSANAAHPQGDEKPATGDAAHARAADTSAQAGDNDTQAPAAMPIAPDQPPMDRWGALAANQATRLWFEQ